MAKKKLNASKLSPAVDSDRKAEIIGIIVIAISILLGLSIISYAVDDYEFAKRQQLLELLDPDTSSRLVQNWLGPVGAYLSHFLVYSLFGYSSILLALLIGYNGWHVFRRHSFWENSWLNLLSIWGIVLLSTFLGWLTSRHRWLF